MCERQGAWRPAGPHKHQLIIGAISPLPTFFGGSEGRRLFHCVATIEPAQGRKSSGLGVGLGLWPCSPVTWVESLEERLCPKDTLCSLLL